MEDVGTAMVWPVQHDKEGSAWRPGFWLFLFFGYCLGIRIDQEDLCQLFATYWHFCDSNEHNILGRRIVSSHLLSMTSLAAFQFMCYPKFLPVPWTTLYLVVVCAGNPGRPIAFCESIFNQSLSNLHCYFPWGPCTAGSVIIRNRTGLFILIQPKCQHSWNSHNGKEKQFKCQNMVAFFTLNLVF